ncbi:MAG: O-antigen ligase family protein [Acidobacteriia bacterium]|nr:O-antigen ligase family protein [Terriglobia bacterium]
MIRLTEELDRVRTAGFALLLMSAAILPFELKTPIMHVGPLGITSVEIVLYLTMGLWGAAWLAGHRPHWTAAHTAVGVWAAVLILSALLAPSHRAEALKFALRGLGGCVLCLAAADFVRTPRSAARVGLALLAGSCLSAAAAQAETWVPGAAVFLRNFKTESSHIGSFLRASGTFQYANIASMYWEASLPLALAVPLWWGSRRFARRWWWTGAVCSFVLIEGILLAASRAGILIAIFTLAALLIICRRSAVRLPSLAVAVLVSMFLLLMVHAASNELLVLRLTTLAVSDWYRADYRDLPERLALVAGTTVRVPLAIRNSGRMKWRARGRQSVAVSYHWLDPAAENILIWGGARSELPSDVEPGATVKVEPWIKAPERPGSYTLQWDMLQEDVAWFSVFGPGKAQMRVQVVPSPIARVLPDRPPPLALPLPSAPVRMDLWRAALQMWLQRPFLGVGPDNFRRLYGSVLGLKHSDDRVYAGNLYLETLANVGLLGTLALVAVLLSLVVWIRKAWIGSRLPEDRLLLVGIGTALAAYCLHGLVDYFLAFSSTYGQFWILVGIILGLGQGGERPR